VTGETAGFETRIATRFGFAGSRMSMLAVTSSPLMVFRRISGGDLGETRDEAGLAAELGYVEAQRA
jgi:hypothetical protein